MVRFMCRLRVYGDVEIKIFSLFRYVITDRRK